MSRFHQHSQSIWQRENSPLFRPLSEDLHTDVCVVGAGIAGLTTAYYLLKEGLRVVVIEKDDFAQNETALTSAHLSNALDDYYHNLKKWHGEDGARLAYESHTYAIDEIERICITENISCEFKRVDGYLFLDPDKTPEFLHREMQTCHELGMSEVQLFVQAPLDFFNSGPCLRYPQQAQFHPLKYLNGLASAIQRLGGVIHTHTAAAEIEGGLQPCVRTVRGTVFCQNVVLATNVPIHDRFSIHTKEAAYRSYVLGVQIPKNTLPPVLLWDTADPYHYVRVQENPFELYDTLLVGGEDHRTGQSDNPEEHYANLKNWVRERFHFAPKVITQWSGQIIEPMDGLAYLGHQPGEDNVFLIAGDSGHGLTHGTIGGLIIRDIILDRPNAWVGLYDPKRFQWRGVGTFVSENLNSAIQYRDWFSSGDVESFREIVPGEGAIVRDGWNKIAAYRDPSGQVHQFSAVCPHLGGIVHWNANEKTWDCPCHGSRFSMHGEVLNGPAAQGLSPIDQQQPRKERDSISATNRQNKQESEGPMH